MRIMKEKDPTLTELKGFIKKIAKDVREIREFADALLMAAETRPISREWIEGVCSKIIELDNDISKTDYGIKQDLKKVIKDIKRAEELLEKVTDK